MEIKEAIVRTPPRAKVIDTNFRRSDRLKGKSKGYKQGTYKDRHCISCSAEPPSMPTSVIKNLGTVFYKIRPEEVTDEALQKKGKPRGQSKKTKNLIKTKPRRRSLRPQLELFRSQKRKMMERKNSPRKQPLYFFIF